VVGQFPICGGEDVERTSGPAPVAQRSREKSKPRREGFFEFKGRRGTGLEQKRACAPPGVEGKGSFPTLSSKAWDSFSAGVPGCAQSV